MEALTDVTTWSLSTGSVQWQVSTGALVSAYVLLILLVVCGFLLNGLLVATILCSPNLKTPPNLHLVNAAVVNLLAMSGAVMCLVSLGLHDDEALRRLGVALLFIRSVCFLEYCAISTAIGYYRYKTVQKLNFLPRNRAGLVGRSTALGWCASSIVAFVLTLSFRKTNTSLTWNAFRPEVREEELVMLTSLDSQHKTFVALYVITYCVLMIVIAKCYCYILRILYNATPKGKSRVYPMQRHRHSSDSSDVTDLFGASSRSYRPEIISVDVRGAQSSAGVSSASPPIAFTSASSMSHPFVISSLESYEYFIVHYRHQSQTVLIDEGFALENPIKAQKLISSRTGTLFTSVYEMNQGSNAIGLTRTSLEHTLSNGSANSNVTSSRKRILEFTDISQGAELKRMQRIKNKQALRSLSIKTERKNLGSTTKNSLVMLGVFTVLSFPMFVCSIPGCLDADMGVTSFNNTLMFTQVVFFFNVVACPLWYLLFSRRVRKCALKLVDNSLLKLHLRK